MTLSPLDRLLAELGIVALIACAAALFEWFAPPGIPLGTRLAIALGGFIAAWVLVRVLATVGAATARLLGFDAVWGYAFAIPFASAAIAWIVLWQISGPDAALGEEFARVWPSTILIAIAFFALFFALYWRANIVAARAGEAREQEVNAGEPSGAADSANSAERGVVSSALHARLPAGFPPIIALMVEDHYVHLIAQARSAMLLMPLAEAVALMPQGTGAQVHRSWWVAQSAVAGHRRKGRDVRLVLAGGKEAPVSRAMVAELREKGWL